MEKGIYVLSRNRSFLSLVSVIADAVLDASVNDGVPKKCSGNASNVVGSVLKVLDAADKYEDEDLQRLVDPLKHQLKVAVAEIRQSCTTSVMNGALSNSIQLLALLQEFEEEYTKKLHRSVLLSLQELEEMHKSDVDDDMQLLVETLQCVPPLIRHLQARLDVVTEKACYLKFHSAAGMGKFYVHFLGQTCRQAAKHANSPSIKVLMTFALQLVCTCLTKMCNAVCGSQTPDTQRQVLMGNFVHAMDQVLYLLLEETSKDGTDQLSKLLEALVTHSMSLYQLSVGDTKQKVYVACKEVLEQKAALENMQTSILSCEQALQYKKSASILERFEATINIAVVELIVDNYMGLILALERLLEAAELYAYQEKSNSTEDGTPDLSIGFKGSVMDFCAAVDQVYNIIQQAVGCSMDEQRVTNLLSELEALEKLDPELVAGAVALATDTNDRGLKTTVSQLQVAWQFHTKTLFLNLLHLCNPDTFFDALDICLKCSIAQLEHSDIRPSMLKKIATIASAAIDMSRIVFEDVGIPESLQVAVDHLAVAISALKDPPEGRFLKRAKVVRGCAWKVRDELKNHLPLSSVEFSGEAEPTKQSCQEQDVEGFKDKHPVLDVTKILNQMHVSVQDSMIEPASENMMSVTFQRKDISKIFPSASHWDLPQVSQRLETSVLQNRGLASILQLTEQQRLEHTIHLSKEAMGHTEMGQWIQNNSSVCTMAVRMKHLVSQLRSDKKVCSAVAELSQMTVRFVEELHIVQSHLETKPQHVVPACQLGKLCSELNCCADKFSITAATLRESTASTVAVAEVIEQLLMLVSTALKLLLQVCGQEHKGKNRYLLQNHSYMSRMWVLPSCTESSV